MTYNSFLPQNWHPLLDAVYATWDLAEVAVAERFLLGAECAVIRRSQLQVSAGNIIIIIIIITNIMVLTFSVG